MDGLTKKVDIKACVSSPRSRRPDFQEQPTCDRQSLGNTTGLFQSVTHSWCFPQSCSWDLLLLWGTKGQLAFQELFVLLFSGFLHLTFPKFEWRFLQESFASSASHSVVFIACQSEIVLTSFDKHLHLESQCGCPENKRRPFFSSFLFMN